VAQYIIAVERLRVSGATTLGTSPRNFLNPGSGPPMGWSRPTFDNEHKLIKCHLKIYLTQYD